MAKAGATKADFTKLYSELMDLTTREERFSQI